ARWPDLAATAGYLTLGREHTTPIVQTRGGASLRLTPVGTSKSRVSRTHVPEGSNTRHAGRDTRGSYPRRVRAWLVRRAAEAPDCRPRPSTTGLAHRLTSPAGQPPCDIAERCGASPHAGTAPAPPTPLIVL